MRTPPRRCVFLIFLWLVPFAGTFGMLRENPRDRLERLRGEVDSLNTLLTSLNAGETDLARRIQTLDQQIAARQSLIRELDAQRAEAQTAVRAQDRLMDQQRAELGEVQRNLEVTRSDVAALNRQVAARAVSLYKSGDRNLLAYLLNSASPGDFLRREVYARKIHERDQVNLNALSAARDRMESAAAKYRGLIESLTRARAEKTAQVERAQLLLADAAAERKLLESDRGRLQKDIAALRQDRDAVTRNIADRNAAIDEVQQWIASLEQQRISGGVQQIGLNSSSRTLVRDVPSFNSFSSARGRLPWPVKGTVVSHFGLERNEETGTVTENPGIDIQAQEGSEVLAVLEGICTRITYVRGFGNTVLISHDNGYYTVYAHLASVWVIEGERVAAGRVIGSVGQSGGAETPRLHFQVWHRQEKQDPLEWLSS